MPLKPSLQLKLALRLQLTPQLKQSIRLLGLSQLELAEELQPLIEANPLLELQAVAGPDGEEEPAAAPAPAATAASEDDSSWEWAMPAAEQVLELTSLVRPSGHDANFDKTPELQTPTPTSLKQHLYWQLELAALPPRQQLIAEQLIDALDEDGYLKETPTEMSAGLPPELAIDSGEIDAVRRQLQQFDPTGVASLDLRDCLQAQLLEQRAHPHYPLAAALLQPSAGDLPAP